MDVANVNVKLTAALAALVVIGGIWWGAVSWAEGAHEQLEQKTEKVTEAVIAQQTLQKAQTEDLKELVQTLKDYTKAAQEQRIETERRLSTLEAHQQ